MQDVVAIVCPLLEVFLLLFLLSSSPLPASRKPRGISEQLFERAIHPNSIAVTNLTFSALLKPIYMLFAVCALLRFCLEAVIDIAHQRTPVPVSHSCHLRSDANYQPPPLALYFLRQGQDLLRRVYAVEGLARGARQSGASDSGASCGCSAAWCI